MESLEELAAPAAAIAGAVVEAAEAMVAMAVAAPALAVVITSRTGLRHRPGYHAAME